MPNTVRVIAAVLPSSTPKQVIIRVRWILGSSIGRVGTVTNPSKVEFPLPEDSFHVSLTIPSSGKPPWEQVVYPHPFVMLDPPRTYRELDSPNFPNPPLMSDWLPQPLAKWKPVDPSVSELVTKDKPNESLALGVVHLLRQASQPYIEKLLRDMAHASLAELRKGKDPRYTGMSDDEIQTHSIIFASVFRLAPHHPRSLFKDLSSLFSKRGEYVVAGRTGALPTWLEAALDAVPKSGGGGTVSVTRKLAVLIHLFRAGQVLGEAVRVAGEAKNVQAMMAMRAGQGGELLDYWCDYDKKISDTPSQTCSPGTQGRRCLAAEAFGLGTDFLLDEDDFTGDIEVKVEHRRPDAQALSAFYAFPADGIFSSYGAGNYRIALGAQRGIRRTRSQVVPPPPAAAFSARIDYDLVSSYTLLPGAELQNELEDMMALAKPITGDGLLSVRVMRNAPVASKDFQYDYLYNLYCIWDGESSGNLQRYIDDPTLQPTLSELRPYLVSRRYSFRRDIADTLDPNRIAALKLHEQPPYEAIIGIANRITQEGMPAPYPSKETLPDGYAQMTVSLRDIFPSPDATNLGVMWERIEGARPDKYTKNAVWTVEGVRPGSQSLDDSRKPQRYRLWVTAVDVFEQESEPIPVMAAAPGEAEDATQTIFVPRWRSAPPPPEEVTTAEVGDKLEVSWKLGQQQLIGTTVKVERSPLDAQLVLLRRPVQELQPVAKLVERGQATDVETGLADPSPVLERAILKALENEAWRVWQAAELESHEMPTGAGKMSWQLAAGDRGYEYKALVAHMVPEALRKFVHTEQSQIVRYLKQVEMNGHVVLAEETWDIPETGEEAGYRNYAAFSAVATGEVKMLLPRLGELPDLTVEMKQSALVQAKPVLGVQGINRDAALAKLLALRDPEGVSAQGLTTAQALVLESALDRIEAGRLGEKGIEMARSLLEAEFVKKDQSGSARATQHPVIGFRGVVQLKWTADPRQGQNHAPTILYRIYTARTPFQTAPDSYPARYDGTYYVLAADVPQLSTTRPSLVHIMKGEERWTGLATASRDNPRHAVVQGLSPLQGQDTAAMKPAPGDDVDCQFAAGYVAAEVSASLAPEPALYEASIPVGGGYREIGAWWVVAVNCINGEEWLTPKGEPAFFTQILFESIVPAKIQRLQVRPPFNFKKDALKEEDYARYREFIPVQLPIEGLAIFPRTILTFDRKEVAGREQYLFIERQTERAATDLAALQAVGPEWGLLKAIETLPTGALWNDDYLILKEWLQGRMSPQPPEGFEPSEPHFFFPIKDKGSAPAWQLKNVSMLAATNVPWKDAHSFVDYFDIPPGEGGGGIYPAKGESRVRYRAYKVVDLMPDLPAPDPGSWASRYLVSEASAWTAWLKAEWPPIRFDQRIVIVPRQDQLLVSFAVASRVAEPFVAFGRMLLDEGSVGRLFYRVAIKREMAGAFSGANNMTVVGKLLEVPLESTDASLQVETADFSLERDGPLDEKTVQYHVTGSLIWRRTLENGLTVDEELRAPGEPHKLTAQIPRAIDFTEAAARIILEVVIG